ncbi:MAG: FtsQ-type POTRA domain-containing protein, partial [Deltaproteobacteria bacterium]|nr:FtsQ-type POTRA domain-containing protein [Deltaproteobacteria bacterium]
MKKEEVKASRFRATFRLIQRTTWGFLLVLILTLTIYLGNRAYRELQGSTYFQVKTIAIHGNHVLSKTDLIYYLGLSEASNLLTLDLKSLFQKLAS